MPRLFFPCERCCRGLFLLQSKSRCSFGKCLTDCSPFLILEIQLPNPVVSLGCVLLTRVFRNRNLGNRSYKSFLFTEIDITFVKHLLNVILNISLLFLLLQNARRTVLNHHSTYSYSGIGSCNRTHPYSFNEMTN